MLTESPSRLLLLALVALLVPFAGCSAPDVVPASETTDPLPDDEPLPGGTPAVRSPELEEARARWEAAGYDAYQMTLQRSCFCPEDYRGPFDVTVRSGEIESIRFNGAEMDAERGMTVEGLFDLLEEAYARGAQTVSVEYDADTGIPTELYIDYDARIADEEVGYTVRDVEAAER